MGRRSEPRVFAADRRLILLCVLSSLAVVLLSAVGCERSRSPGDYVPAAEAARAWLEQSLQRWREGRPATSFGAEPAIQFADARAQAGRKLADFEITGELPVDGGRRFQVRMTFAEPAETIKRQYVVFGIDPIWVVDQEDFDMITHWDHPMHPTTSEATPDPTTESKGASGESAERPAQQGP